MLTIRDFKAQRRMQLLEFFSWRFGTPDYTKALAYCTGLNVSTIRAFRRVSVPWESMQLLEDAALHLGFRPSRTALKNGQFVKPKTLRLPRWADAACRIRFYQWRKETERKAKRDKMAHKVRRGGTLDAVSRAACVTTPCNNPNPEITQLAPPALVTSG
jgi:hypothetical protein